MLSWSSRCALGITAVLLLTSLTARAQQHFTNCLPTNVNDASVLVPTDAPVALSDTTARLQSGDEIALFSDDGTCAGVAVVDTTKATLALAVADRDSTAGLLAGYESGEPLKYRLWRRASDKVVTVSSTGYECTLAGCRSDGQYRRDAVYEVDRLTVGESSALPVELASFQATRKGTAAVLVWRTTSEKQNAGFKVQHKSESATTWSTDAFVDGAGTTSSARRYRHTVKDLSYGPHEFRLKQIDQGGSSSLSTIRRIEVTLDKAYQASSVYPNPVRHSGTLDLTVRKEQRVVVRLYDVLGRAQEVVLDRSLPADRTVPIRLEADRLTSGRYFLRIRGEKFRATRSVTVVK